MIGTQRYVKGQRADPENTEPDGFYPTPPEATIAFLALENVGPKLWEPACGDGMMSRVFEEAGREVISTDLVDRSYGTPRVDFLLETKLQAPEIYTNPPFKNAEQFVAHALGLGAEKVGMLLRLAWLEGEARKTGLFDRTPPVRVWVSSRRLSMKRAGTDGGKGGGSMVAFAWYVWERGYRGPGSQINWFDWADFAPELHAQQLLEKRLARKAEKDLAAPQGGNITPLFD